MRRTPILLSILASILLAASVFGEATPQPPARGKEDGSVTVSKTVTAVIKNYSKDTTPPKGSADEGLSGIDIKISIPELKSSDGNSAPIEAINTAILGKVLSAGAGDAPPASSVEMLIENFTRDYETARKENPEMIGGWSLGLTGRILYSDEDLFCLEYTDSSYTGGAHPLTAIDYTVFSLKTGAPIPIESLTLAGKQDELTRLAEPLFRKAREMKPGESLVDAGFTFEKDKFALNANYRIQKDGLGFFFNPYEVAPYALGTTDILIPWADLKGVIDPKGPAGKFLP